MGSNAAATPRGRALSKARNLRKTASNPASTTSKRSSPRKTGFATILVPIDFSPASLFPVQWAKFIARRTNASVSFVHVHTFVHPLGTAFIPPVIDSEAEIEERLYRDLQAVARRQKVSKASFQIRAGRPFAEICRLAGEIQADLIALSSHGRTGWERAFLGSTTERVIRHAPCPVLVARPLRASRKEEFKLQKILVPVDFSDCSARGLNYAIGLAQLFGTELALLHVVRHRHDLPPILVRSYGKLSRWAREVAEAHMADLLGETDFGGVKFTTAIKTGSAARKVCRYALKISADLIVTSTHGRTGLAHVLIGSTAEQIVRYAKSPVLVVPTRMRKMA